MFDKVIRDPDWRAALHGRPVMRAEYAGEVFYICPAKAIHPASGQVSGRCDNPYNLALMIKHRRSYEAWKELPWFSVCDAEERELFCIQSPAGDNAVGRMMLESRVKWILKIRHEVVIPWLQAHGVNPEELNVYAMHVHREFPPEE